MKKEAQSMEKLENVTRDLSFQFKNAKREHHLHTEFQERWFYKYKCNEDGSPEYSHLRLKRNVKEINLLLVSTVLINELCEELLMNSMRLNRKKSILNVVNVA